MRKAVSINHRADGSREIEFSDGSYVEMGIQPSPQHIWNWTTNVWEFDVSIAWKEVRKQRDRLIAETDWTQLPDVSPDAKQRYIDYRQALRDITEQPDPLAISWPSKPM